jgi:hypothetical protein
VSVIGHARQRNGASWPRLDQVIASHDGSRLLRITQVGELLLDALDGQPPRTIAPLAAFASWSVDQRDIYFTDDSETIKQLPATTGVVRTVFATGFATTRLVVAGIGPVQRDGRMPLVLQRPRATGPFETSLWSAVADPIRQQGARRQLTPWREAGVVLTASGDNGEAALSVSADSTRVAFLRVMKQEDVYVAAYDAGRGLLETPRRFTLDEREDRPSAWTPDG